MNYCDMVISPKKMRSILDIQMNRSLKDKDFTASQVPFILEIGDNEGISMKDLCTSIGVDKALTTRVIRALIDNGLVENRSESSRTYKLYLTEKGIEAKKLAIDNLERVLGQIFEALTEEEVQTLRNITSKINKRLSELYEY